MKVSKIILLILVSLLIISVQSKHRFPKYKNVEYQFPIRYSVGRFTQKVSHFNFRSLGTFSQKYLIDTTYWNKANRGPILFYCGNQGPIEMFYNNSGWYNQYVSKQLGGMILYMQHRYFGESWPFGDQKTSFLKENLVYLTTSEATMDYVNFLTFIKETYCSNCPIVAFGGSYGAMLATWMRMKYPYIVDMAHSSSGPTYYYRNRQNLNLGIFYEIVTNNYLMHSANCPNVIRQGFKRLINYSNNASAPLFQLSTYFNLCKPLSKPADINLLIDYIDNGYSYMAMLNYPYPTSFLKNLPAWPANSSCTPLNSVNPTSSDKDLFSALRLSVQYYYNYQGSNCNDIYSDTSSDQDMSGWNVLACSDQAMPMNTDGTRDMFWKSNFDYTGYSQYCKDNYGIQPDYDFTLRFFSGVTDKQYLQSSRIMFTSGNLDPWSGGGPTTTLSADLPACYIIGGAHHLDLRPPNALDPVEAVNCRKAVIGNLTKWINEVKQNRDNQIQI